MRWISTTGYFDSQMKAVPSRGCPEVMAQAASGSGNDVVAVIIEA
jgi:hypothetical protein